MKVSSRGAVAQCAFPLSGSRACKTAEKKKLSAVPQSGWQRAESTVIIIIIIIIIFNIFIDFMMF